MPSDISVSCKLRKRLSIARQSNNRRRRANRSAAVWLDAGPAPFFVYQMGKVGSSTIAGTLKSTLPHNPVYQVHFLTTDGIQTAWKDHMQAGFRTAPYHLWLSRALSRRIPKLIPPQRWKIITGVREPVGWLISNLFQNPALKGAMSPSNRQGLDVAQAIRWLNMRLSDQNVFQYQLEWFDRELNRLLGFDIFSVEFDRLNGYSIYTDHQYTVLAITMESFEQSLIPALTTFLGLSSLATIRSENIRSDSKNQDAYREVINRIRIPDSALRIYDHPKIRHFYTDDQIQKFTERWS